MLFIEKLKNKKKINKLYIVFILHEGMAQAFTQASKVLNSEKFPKSVLE
jgi:hypothetical protein